MTSKLSVGLTKGAYYTKRKCALLEAREHVDGFLKLMPIGLFLPNPINSADYSEFTRYGLKTGGRTLVVRDVPEYL